MTTFEKHLRSVSRAAAQRHGIMRKSLQLFQDRSLILRYFWSLVMPVLEYCSAVWCPAADSHIILLDRVVRSAGFLAGGVLECNLAHQQSLAVMCMPFKNKSNPMHPLSGTLPFRYMPARATHGALVAHGYSFTAPRFWISQYRRTFVPLSLSLWNGLSDPVFHGEWLAGLKSRANSIMLAWSDIFFVSFYFRFFFHPWVVCGLRSSDW